MDNGAPLRTQRMYIDIAMVRSLRVTGSLLGLGR